jgi:hypothetical protein
MRPISDNSLHCIANRTKRLLKKLLILIIDKVLLAFVLRFSAIRMSTVI